MLYAGYSDWSAPLVDELSIMMNNKIAPDNMQAMPP